MTQPVSNEGIDVLGHKERIIPLLEMVTRIIFNKRNTMIGIGLPNDVKSAFGFAGLGVENIATDGTFDRYILEWRSAISLMRGLEKELLGELPYLMGADMQARDPESAITASGVRLYGGSPFMLGYQPIVRRCAIYGMHAFTGSIKPRIEGSLVFGDQALGSTHSDTGPGMSNEYVITIPEVQMLAEVQQDLFSEQAEAVFSAIMTVSNALRKREIDGTTFKGDVNEINGWATAEYNMLWAGYDLGKLIATGSPPIILKSGEEFKHYFEEVHQTRVAAYVTAYGLLLEKLVTHLPKSLRVAMRHQIRSGDAAFAAVKLEDLLAASRVFPYAVNIDDCIIAGSQACQYIGGGTIRNSIIAGPDALLGANVRIVNSWLITEDVTRFIGDEVFGHPDVYERLGIRYTPPNCSRTLATLLIGLAGYPPNPN